MLLTIDVDEDFVDEEGNAIASVLSLQSTAINGPELDTPKANPFPSDGDASFSQEILYISMTEIESVVEPDGIRNDIWRESVALISIHGPNLAISAR